MSIGKSVPVILWWGHGIQGTQVEQALLGSNVAVELTAVNE